MGVCLRWQLVALAITAFLSAGCTNRVIADTPRYSIEEASSRFTLKDGLWLVDSRKCAVDSDLPVAAWPDCAQWGVVQGGRPLLPEVFGTERGITVDGEPMIQEISDCPQAIRESADGSQAVSGPMNEKVRICYNGLLVEERDGEQRVTAFVTWPVFCGPLPPKGQSVTETPWDGLKIRGDNCLAENEAALRNAARRSFSLIDGSDLASRSRWVRANFD